MHKDVVGRGVLENGVIWKKSEWIKKSGVV